MSLSPSFHSCRRFTLQLLDLGEVSSNDDASPLFSNGGLMSELAVEVVCRRCGTIGYAGHNCAICADELPESQPCDICGVMTEGMQRCSCGEIVCPKCWKCHGCNQSLSVTEGIEPVIDGSYRVWRIPKRNGSFRVIEEPNPELKQMQRNILKLLLRLLPTLGPHAHGFMKWRSIVTNARRHFRRDPDTKVLIPPQCLLKVDLRDFFPSVTSEMVWKAGKEWRIPTYLAEEVQKFCFKSDRLPQGSPTSPFLANLAATKLDFRLAGLIRAWRGKSRYQEIRYSRYADDMAFSSDYPRLIDLIHPIRKITSDCGFTVHPNKIEFHRQPAQLRICGIVINHKISVERNYWRGLRAMIHGALMDNKSGTVPAGHYLANGRKRMKQAAGITGTPGMVSRENLPPEAQEVLVGLPTEPIPWEQWAGKVSFVKSVDSRRGTQLQEELEELRRVCG